MLLLFANIIATLPQGLVDPGLMESVLASEFRGALNESATETLERLKSVTIIFRGKTKKAWTRTPVQRFGNGYGVTFRNQEVTARVLEFGAPDRVGGSPGFSRPPPIKSASAGAGRTIYDWVQEVEPVFVSELRAKIEAGRSEGQGALFRPDGGSVIDPSELAARKAAHAIAAAIFKRGLPSPSNHGALLAFTRELRNQAEILEEQLLPEAIEKAFRSLNLPVRGARL